MSDPRVGEIRARLDHPHVGDIDYLLTKLDEAEKANPPVEVGSPDGSQVYEIPLTEYLEQLSASQIFRATQAEEKLAAAEERERTLIAGVREALEAFEHSESYWDGERFLLPAEYARTILSRLLPSTPTEEGKNDAE